MVELQTYSRACNDGEELDEDEIEQVQGYFECTEAGHLTEAGFLQMYYMQSESRPADTWGDRSATVDHCR